MSVFSGEFAELNHDIGFHHAAKVTEGTIKRETAIAVIKNETWWVNAPTKDIIFTASDHDSDKNIFLSLRAPEVGKGSRHVGQDPNTGRATLIVKQFLLPYQGISVKWAPMDTSAAARQKIAIPLQNKL